MYSGPYNIVAAAQQTRNVVPMLDQCWSSVVDGGPALGQHLLFLGGLVRTRAPGYTAVLTWLCLGLKHVCLNTLQGEILSRPEVSYKKKSNGVLVAFSF